MSDLVDKYVRNDDMPTIPEAHEVRDYIAELVADSIVWDAAICRGITLGRKRALERTQSAQQQGGEV